MAVVKKTVSIPEELYREAVREGKSFSKVVGEALREYLKSKRKERLKSLWGTLKDLGIKEGTEFVNELRSEQLKAQEDRERWQDT
ncbi:hypothetical protein [Hydrogenivirga caldilitoris]|nr:hypothetical protein [Hydrogenivirga caldilitoris]